MHASQWSRLHVYIPLGQIVASVFIETVFFLTRVKFHQTAAHASPVKVYMLVAQVAVWQTLTFGVSQSSPEVGKCRSAQCK